MPTGAIGYRVFDRADASRRSKARPAARAARSTRADSGDVIAVRLIEPLQGNAAALGVNGLSIPAARAAIQQAIDSGHPAATAGFRLTQQEATDKRMGIVVYQAIYEGEPATRPSAAPRCAALSS